MLVAKIIICILTIIALFVAHLLDSVYTKSRRSSHIAVIISGILGVIFCVLMIATNWNLFTIPKILLFISVYLYIYSNDEWGVCFECIIVILITAIAFLVATIIYLNNFEKCEVPDVSTTTCNVICANDSSSFTGSMSGSILYVHGSVSEYSVYKYYYPVEDGGIKQGTIPAYSTTIYFVKPGEETYLETTVTTEYSLNKNNSPATRCREYSTTTYKLYIPEGSVTNVFEFDAE